MEKESLKEQIRFIEIVRGSTAEFAAQVYIGMDIAYIEKSDGKEWIDKSDHILARLANLKKAIKSQPATRNTQPGL